MKKLFIWTVLILIYSWLGAGQTAQAPYKPLLAINDDFSLFLLDLDHLEQPPLQLEGNIRCMTWSDDGSVLYYIKSESDSIKGIAYLPDSGRFVLLFSEELEQNRLAPSTGYAYGLAYIHRLEAPGIFFGLPYIIEGWNGWNDYRSYLYSLVNKGVICTDYYPSELTEPVPVKLELEVHYDVPGSIHGEIFMSVVKVDQQTGRQQKTLEQISNTSKFGFTEDHFAGGGCINEYDISISPSLDMILYNLGAEIGDCYEENRILLNIDGTNETYIGIGAGFVGEFIYTWTHDGRLVYCGYHPKKYKGSPAYNEASVYAMGLDHQPVEIFKPKGYVYGIEMRPNPKQADQNRPVSDGNYPNSGKSSININGPSVNENQTLSSTYPTEAERFFSAPEPPPQNVVAADIMTRDFTEEEFMRAFFGNYYTALGLSVQGEYGDPAYMIDHITFHPDEDQSVNDLHSKIDELLSLRGSPYYFGGSSLISKDTCLVEIDNCSWGDAAYGYGSDMCWCGLGWVVLKWKIDRWVCAYYDLDCGLTTWGGFNETPISDTELAISISEFKGAESHLFCLIDDIPRHVLTVVTHDNPFNPFGNEWGVYREGTEIVSIKAEGEYYDLLFYTNGNRYIVSDNDYVPNEYRQFRRYRYNPLNRRYCLVDSWNNKTTRDFISGAEWLRPPLFNWPDSLLMVTASDIVAREFSEEDFMRSFFGNYFSALGVSALIDDYELHGIEDYYGLWIRNSNKKTVAKHRIDKGSREYSEYTSLRDKLLFKYVRKLDLMEDTCLVLFAGCQVEVDLMRNVVTSVGDNLGMAVMKWTDGGWQCLYYNLWQSSLDYQRILDMSESNMFIPISESGKAIKLPSGNHMLICELMDDIPRLVLTIEPPEDYSYQEDYIWTHENIHVLPEMVGDHHGLEVVSTGLSLTDNTQITDIRRYRYSLLEREYRLIEPDQANRLPSSR